MTSSHNNQPTLERALATARRLKPGTWKSVETLALLALETAAAPDGAAFLEAASSAASQLKAGNWESARALAWLARAEREVSPR